MNRPVWLSAFFLAVALPAYGRGGADPTPQVKPDPAAAAAEAARQVAADLKEARDLLRKVTDKPTRERLELLLTRSELRLAELQKNVARLTAPARPTAASAEDFARVLKGVKAESFDDRKVSFIEDFGKGRHYTSAQVRELLAAFSFDQGRAKAAIALYPRVIDPDNFFTALEVFTFESGRNEVREKLKLKK